MLAKHFPDKSHLHHTNTPLPGARTARLHFPRTPSPSHKCYRWGVISRFTLEIQQILPHALPRDLQSQASLSELATRPTAEPAVSFLKNSESPYVDQTSRKTVGYASNFLIHCVCTPEDCVSAFVEEQREPGKTEKFSRLGNLEKLMP